MPPLPTQPAASRWPLPLMCVMLVRDPTGLASLRPVLH